MEELNLLYEELLERQNHLESRKKTTITEGRIAENLLTIVRVQELLLPLVIEKSEKSKKCECGGNERISLDCTMKPCKYNK